ncbi:hypothetical protein [Streptomyces noursei]|uniref:Uncharacterized protein n=1 Tax=Streptomyces noursei TaxID=1971 RepID=A0A2N8PBJ8_STRNR|nr:hypothetical protein [Streptomyces noursei]PNE38383.1 hypothetical protein AOB60_30545 [Streptomyces noursei]
MPSAEPPAQQAAPARGARSRAAHPALSRPAGLPGPAPGMRYNLGTAGDPVAPLGVPPDDVRGSLVAALTALTGRDEVLEAPLRVRRAGAPDAAGRPVGPARRPGPPGARASRAPTSRAYRPHLAAARHPPHHRHDPQEPR